LDEIAKERFAAIRTGGFDRALAEMELLEVHDGRVRVRLPVGDGLKNLGGKMHGGALATLVDDVGTVAIISRDRDSRAGVSTDLNVSFFAPGEGAVIAEAQVLKHGRTLSFVTVDVRRESDGVLVAQGRMTKHLG
jgi:acyl-coenzyme A thioesterase 13